jgi:proteasome lid subunit RPN8/RPN11
VAEGLFVARDVYRLMIDHCLDDYPREACGVLAGTQGTTLAHEIFTITNVELSTRFYRFDEQEQLRVWREMDDSRWDPLVIYHSHTVEPTPNRRGWDLSKTDIDLALDPKIAHMVVDIHDPTTINFGLWRVRDGIATAVPWGVVD